MVKFWIRVGVLAAGLAAVILAQKYLKDVAGLNYADAPEPLENRALEVETQAAGESSGEKEQF